MRRRTYTHPQTGEGGEGEGERQEQRDNKDKNRPAESKDDSPPIMDNTWINGIIEIHER